MNDKEQGNARLSEGVVLCSTCRLQPSRPQQRTCRACHVIYQQTYRQRRKAYVRELQAIIDGLTGKDPATEDTWRKVVGSRHVLVVPPDDSFADVFAGLVTGFFRPSPRSAHIGPVSMTSTRSMEKRAGVQSLKSQPRGAVSIFAQLSRWPGSYRSSRINPRQHAVELPTTAI